MIKTILGVLFFIGCYANDARAADLQSWPQPGGVSRNFVIPDRPLNFDFAGGKPRVSFAINAGFGICPPVIADGRLYTNGFYPPGTTPETIVNPHDFISCSDAFSNPKKRPAIHDNELADSPSYSTHYGGPRGEEWATCWEISSGKLLWATKLTDQAFVYRENNIVSDEASPLLYDGRLYVHVISGRLFCLDAASGNLQWQRNLYETHMLQWAQKQGNVCGPVAVGNVVAVSFIGQTEINYSMWGQCCLVAAGFDTRSGETRWITTVPITALRANNGRLNLAKVDGQDEILAPCGKGTAALNPTTGKVLWSYEISGDVPFPWTSYTPTVWQDGNQTYIFDAVDAAHDDAQSQSWCLLAGAHEAKLLWANHDFKPYSMIQKSNVVIRDGRLYGFDARAYGNETGNRQKGLPPGRGKRKDGEGCFQCRDIRTGRLIWSTDDFGPKEVNSPTYLLLCGSHLIATHHTGLYVGELNDNGIKTVLHLPMQGGDMAEPVLVGNTLFVRQQDLSHNDITASEGKVNLFGLNLSK